MDYHRNEALKAYRVWELIDGMTTPNGYLFSGSEAEMFIAGRMQMADIKDQLEWKETLLETKRNQPTL